MRWGSIEFITYRVICELLVCVEIVFRCCKKNPDPGIVGGWYQTTNGNGINS